MNHHPIATRLLIAGILGAASLAVCATPGAPAKPAAAKPKLAPRPVPGLSASPAPVAAPMPPIASVVKRTAVRTTGASTPANAPAEARILMIFRSGTAGIPPVPATPAASAGSGEAGLLQPASLATPRPGQVRIISKAEADALAAQPHP